MPAGQAFALGGWVVDGCAAAAAALDGLGLLGCGHGAPEKTKPARRMPGGLVVTGTIARQEERMNADQVIEGIGKAVAAVNPAQEYCFLWINWWPMCMTKGEWSGWAQAVAVIATLLIPAFLRCISRWKNIKTIRRLSLQIYDECKTLDDVSRILKSQKYSKSPTENIDEALIKFKYFNEPQSAQINLLAEIDPNISFSLALAVRSMRTRMEIIEELRKRDDLVSDGMKLMGHLFEQSKRLNKEIDDLKEVADSIKKIGIRSLF